MKVIIMKPAIIVSTSWEKTQRLLSLAQNGWFMVAGQRLLADWDRVLSSFMVVFDSGATCRVSVLM